MIAVSPANHNDDLRTDPEREREREGKSETPRDGMSEIVGTRGRGGLRATLTERQRERETDRFRDKEIESSRTQGAKNRPSDMQFHRVKNTDKMHKAPRYFLKARAVY